MLQPVLQFSRRYDTWSGCDSSTSGLKTGALGAVCSQDGAICATVITGDFDGGAIRTASCDCCDGGGGATLKDGATHTFGAQASNIGCLSVCDDLDELPNSLTSLCTIT